VKTHHRQREAGMHAGAIAHQSSFGLAERMTSA
jgi:hypothetical protein